MTIESEVDGPADDIELAAERHWLNGMEIVAAKRLALADHFRTAHASNSAPEARNP
ncbi:hypothetical protein A6F68_02535 [Tsuneonella dongtanensis]|uniref:Uncharacterized protein n=1 Tax=Tsuneonella dongtanensis TaxID=692370 RepID=A0A1B2AFV8_9SPHN|nr:hypothetical protein [Tsuneonella dongtanensis]ANY21030.1 hypothetical protein A6F68_02535 [Tsuneonella dongtanensis]